MWHQLPSSLRNAVIGASTVLAFALGGCDEGAVGDDEGLGEGVGGKGDVPVSDAQMTPSTNNSLAVLFGWDYLHDAAMPNRCVKSNPDTAEGKPYRVGEVQSRFDLSLVDERSELASELGLDLELAAKYAGASADGKSALLDDFSRNSTSISYLVTMRREYTVRTRHELQLSDGGQAKAAEGIHEFLDACGTHYARGMRYGAEVFVMVTYVAADQSTARKLEADLGISSGDAVEGGELNGNVGAKLASAANRAGVNVEISIAAQGFTVDNARASAESISGLLGDGLNENTFEGLQSLYVAMLESVEQDRCRDEGRDSCWSAGDKQAAGCGGDGEAACGYAYNDNRKAIANGVAAGLYTSIIDWPRELDADMERAMEVFQDNEDYMRSLGKVLRRMSDVYLDEVRPFQRASQVDKAAYNVPVGKVAAIGAFGEPFVPSSVAQMVEVTDEWAFQFMPAALVAGNPAIEAARSAAFESSPPIEIEIEMIEEELADCYRTSATNLARRCEGYSSDALIASANAEIERYAETGRVLPIDARHEADARVYFADAVGQCEQTNFGTEADPIWGRLPTREEAVYLAPMVAYGNIDWSGADMRHTIWYADSDDDGCTDNHFAKVMISEPSSDGPTFECVEVDFWGNEILALCVPPSGPTGSPSAP